MRKILFALIAVGTVAAAVPTAAEASGGCGPYRHRTYRGFCVPYGGYGYARPYYGPRAFIAPGFGFGYRRPYYHRHYY